MYWIKYPEAFWLVVAVQFVGLLCLALTHVGRRWHHSLSCHVAFIIALAAVGGFTMFSIGIGSGDWTAGGMTLAVMVIGAMVDFRQRPKTVWQV